ncbi:MAG: hypothetical protein LBV09_06215 [Deferribacteraceae bacterium]|nr:hypothetical protein [Deferribacteraceae bacterium]
MSDERSKFKVVLYAAIGISIVVACSWLVVQLIIDVWNPPFLDPVEKTVPARLVEMRDATNGIQPDNYTVAYRNPTDELYNERFHDWEIPAPEDKVSACISCHGRMPHNKDERTRAFLNKHDMHMACETCHMRTSASFGWYDIETGDIRSTIQLNEPLLVSAYKLIHVNNRQTNIDNSGLIASADAFMADAANMPAAEKRSALESFHKNKLETPVACKACHTSEVAKSYLPLEKLGYTPFRAKQVVSTEVVGMVEHYGDFYLPTFLSGQGDK